VKSTIDAIFYRISHENSISILNNTKLIKIPKLYNWKYKNQKSAACKSPLRLPKYDIKKEPENSQIGVDMTPLKLRLSEEKTFRRDLQMKLKKGLLFRKSHQRSIKSDSLRSALLYKFQQDKMPDIKYASSSSQH
jgi:hypothetical protein